MHPALSVRISTALPARLPRRWSGSWAKGGLDDRDVVGRSIGPGIARAQLHRQRFTGPRRAMVDERPQRMKAKALTVD